MARTEMALEALLASAGEPLVYCPIRYRQALGLAQEVLDALRAKESDAETLAQAEADLQLARQMVDEHEITFRFRNLGESEHSKLQVQLDIDMAELRVDPQRREQARQLTLAPIAHEPDEVLVDTILALSVQTGNYPTDPETIAHPERLMQLAAENLRTYVGVVSEFASAPTVVAYQDLIDQLEMEATVTDWEPHLKRLGLHLTQQDEADLALLDDGTPQAAENIRQAKREMYDRAVAVICEANRLVLETQKAQYLSQSRATLEATIVNMTLDRMAGKFARTQYINRLLHAMTEVEVEDGWRPAFGTVEMVDRLASGKAETVELYSWLCEQIVTHLPIKESQLVQSARFRDAMDDIEQWGERILA